MVLLVPTAIGVGLAMGSTTLAGFVPGLGAFLAVWPWFVFLIWLQARNGEWDRGFFAKGLVSGAVTTAVIQLIQVAFFETYLGNNPEIVTGGLELPEGWTARQLHLAMTPVVALIFGTGLGMLTAISGAVGRRMQT